MGKIKDGFRKFAQPIPAKEIQAHYPAQLEVELAVIKAQQQLAAVVIPAKEAFASLCQKYGVAQDEWDFDLKLGTMTKKQAQTETQQS